MAVVLENANKVWERCRIDSIRHVAAANLLRALKKHHNDVLRNPDLQFVSVQCVFAADTVINVGPLKLYFLLVVKAGASITNSWVKGSDHATAVAASGDISVPLVGTGGGGKAQMLCFPDGLPFATGLVLASHTAVLTAVRSADADSCTGFAILGGA